MPDQPENKYSQLFKNWLILISPHPLCATVYASSASPRGRWHCRFYTCFGFFIGVEGFDLSSLGVLIHVHLVCLWFSLALFLSTLRALPCALSRLYYSLGRSSLPGELHGLANRWVRTFLIEELIRLLNALVELVRLDIFDVWISFGR